MPINHESCNIKFNTAKIDMLKSELTGVTVNDKTVIAGALIRPLSII